MSKNLFNSIPVETPRRNIFNLSHNAKLTANFGWLIPSLVEECIPGDSFHTSTDSLVRASPMIAPVMDRANIMHHTFFVPYRLLWQNWEAFIAGPTTGNDVPAFPTLSFVQNSTLYDNIGEGALADYLGLPRPEGTGSAVMTISAMFHAAYQLIYNEWYRDQNLIDPLVQPQNYLLVDGDNGSGYGPSSLGSLRTRAFEHDYFTGSLPFAQKGDPVTIPIAGYAPLVMRPSLDTGTDTTIGIAGEQLPSTTEYPNLVTADISHDTSIEDTDRYYANLEATSSTTINDLRAAIKVQEWLELMARSGTRYTEQIFGAFGVRSSDARLQRPEFITGSRCPVVFSEVLNTTGTDSLPQGNMAGHGISLHQGNGGKYFCEEHGVLMTITSIMPKASYYQGIARKFLKFTDYSQYAWPQFANLGEQPIELQEIYAWGSSDANVSTFGYVPRYAEYKTGFDRVCRLYRTSLNYWHFGRDFGAPPSLNQAFIEVDYNDMDRCFADIDGSTDHFLCIISHNLVVSRLLPKYGVPDFS